MDEDDAGRVWLDNYSDLMNLEDRSSSYYFISEMFFFF